jgi:hypothetical protein
VKKIETLVEDIYGLFKGDFRFDRESVSAFAEALSQRLHIRLSEEREKGRLRLSNIGHPCHRKLWYLVNKPELASELSPSTRIKFLFGDILEELLLFLARVAGHTVTREQEEVTVAGVKGHIDGFIDGELVDCKSASPYSFRKFAEHTLPDDDAFGYVDQLGSYGHGTGSDKGHFLAIEKSQGDICLDTYETPKKDYEKCFNDVKAKVASPEPPPRAFEDQPFGESGNKMLGVNCSYCDFKKACWPGLRAFAYSRKPVYLTQVNRPPRKTVQEIEVD